MRLDAKKSEGQENCIYIIAEIDICSDQAAKLESDGADSNRERK